MLKSLNSGVSGVQQFQNQIDAIGNNIANINTPGFKSGRVDFADTFSHAITAGGSGSGTLSQIGSGVSTSAVSNVFTQGTPTETQVETHFAVLGEGFFMVKDPVSKESFATRAGNFVEDSQGYLTTLQGLRVQGLLGDSNQAGDIHIQDDPAARPDTVSKDVAYKGRHFSEDGSIWIQLADGSRYQKGRVLLENFRSPQSLEKMGENLYGQTATAGPISGGGFPFGGIPGTEGLGIIRSGALELSNVDLTREFASLITSQRSFQASARMITTSDELLQEVVNLKR